MVRRCAAGRKCPIQKNILNWSFLEHIMNILQREADMDGQQATTMRDDNGRFVPGCSGNPAGKRKGTRNRATILAEALRDGEGEAVARTVIDKALAGDPVTARFCLALLAPKPRFRAITLDLPETARPGDVVAFFDATLAAMASGEITPDEALVVTRVLDLRLRAMNALQVEERPTSCDRPAPRDAAMPDRTDDSAPVDDDAAPPATPPTVVAAPVRDRWAATCISPAFRGPVAARRDSPPDRRRPSPMICPADGPASAHAA
jgi:hypothetical protein